MELTVNRTTKTGKSTIGELLVNGTFFCYTLEDADRGLKQSDSLLSIKARKLFGITAIPAGRYEVVLSFSNRFKKVLPELKAVPGYEGVRIHPGNTAEDTEGCILVGTGKATDTISNSRAAFEKLMALLEPASKTGKIYITIQ